MAACGKDRGSARGSRFFSLAELNQAIAELVTDLNTRPMRHLGLVGPLALAHERACKAELAVAIDAELDGGLFGLAHRQPQDGKNRSRCSALRQCTVFGKSSGEMLRKLVTSTRASSSRPIWV
jgi:hypothetical protein